MKPAIAGALELLQTRLAHRKIRHRRSLSLIGQPGNNGQPRSTLSTGDERIQVSPILRTVHLGKAFIANGKIGCHGCGRGRHMLARQNPKSGLTRDDADFALGKCVNPCEGRRSFDDRSHKGLYVAAKSLNFNRDSTRLIAGETRQMRLRCCRVDEGAKPHTLHDASHGQANSKICSHSVVDPVQTALRKPFAFAICPRRKILPGEFVHSRKATREYAFEECFTTESRHKTPEAPYTGPPP